MLYSKEQQQTAIEGSQKISEQETFKNFLKKYVDVWSNLGKLAGFTTEEIRAYATLLAWVDVSKLLEQSNDEEGALISSTIVWMYWNTDYCPEFASAINKKTNYMSKVSKG